MKLKKTEAALLAIALAAGVFTAGYFTGRAVTGGVNVVVEHRDEVPAPPPSEDGEDLVDINTASLQELQTLPGIGEVLAGRIIDYREEHGAFLAKEDLLSVPGLGEKTFEGLEDRIKLW